MATNDVFWDPLPESYQRPHEGTTRAVSAITPYFKKAFFSYATGALL